MGLTAPSFHQMPLTTGGQRLQWSTPLGAGAIEFDKTGRVTKTEPISIIPMPAQAPTAAEIANGGPVTSVSKPNKPAASPQSAGGAGTELKALLLTLGISSDEKGCACNSMAMMMNSLGAAKCSKYAYIVTMQLCEQADAAGWSTKLAVAAKAAVTMPGLAVAYSTNGTQAAMLWLVKQAIANAAAKGSKACACNPSVTA